MKYKCPNIIIGAGPAGLQLGYFFKKADIKYIILEKSDIAGSFFTQYPHSDKLISINKKYTGSDDKEFNLRHDWNSLLSDGDKFTTYSDDYYPDKKDLVKYLNDFAKNNELNIIYNTNVVKITKVESKYVLETPEDTYICEKLIVATGLSKPNIPLNILNKYENKIKHYGEYEKDYFKKPENLEQFKNKSLLILGTGNSGYELANLLNPYCSSISIHGRNMKALAVSSHYSGDIRSIYLPFLDTFFLKSLNSMATHSQYISLNIDEQVSPKTKKTQYHVSFICSNNCKEEHPLYDASRSSFDHIILCTGWKFDTSIFDFPVKAEKYPTITHKYESVNNPNLFFIGALMHSIDYKKSSGGFIHGFRYLIKNFININYNIPYEINTFDKNDVIKISEYIYNKINSSSALYQMYGHICDFFYYDYLKKEIIYYNNVNLTSVYSKYIDYNSDIFMILTLEYGSDNITDFTKLGKKMSSIGSEAKANLLHPIITVVTKANKMIDRIHFDEDLFADFSHKDLYLKKIMRTMKMYSA